MLLQSPITNPVISPLVGKGTDDAPALFGKIISGIIGVMLVGASIWVFFQLILGAINWISSGGDKGKIEIAQHRITNAIIGVFIVFASWTIYLIILQFFGLSPIGAPGEIIIKFPSLL